MMNRKEIISLLSREQELKKCFLQLANQRNLPKDIILFIYRILQQDKEYDMNQTRNYHLVNIYRTTLLGQTHLIYDESDYKNKTISRKLNENELEIGHNKIRKNSIVIITNPENNKSIRLKVSKRVKYPDFFKALITKAVSQKLQLNPDMPFVEIQERAINTSFVAKKAVTFSEEQQVSNKVPVTKVKIDNISSKKQNKIKKNKKFTIIVGEFYSEESATNLKDTLEDKYVKKGSKD